jgi:hypothetical protein
MVWFEYLGLLGQGSVVVGGEGSALRVLAPVARTSSVVSGLVWVSWSLWPGLADWWWAEMSVVVTAEEDLGWLLPGLGLELQDLVKEDGGCGRRAPSQCPTVL